MGGNQSSTTADGAEPEKDPETLTRHYHNHGGQGIFLSSRDFFTKRNVSFADEPKYYAYYTCYFEACSAALADSTQFTPNEEYQQALESVDENLYARAEAVAAVTKRHAHDVISFVVRIVEELTVSSGLADEDDEFGQLRDDVSIGDDALQGSMENSIGKGWVKHGFFFFLWTKYSGEKFGRLEARACRNIADLMTPAVRVPLTYHVQYKGRSVTVQGLVPVSQHTRVAGTSAEWMAATKQIASALNLRPFEKFGAATLAVAQERQKQETTHSELSAFGPVTCADREVEEIVTTVVFTPPETQCHEGYDGRRYVIVNFQWLPRLPPPTRRGNAEHFFSSVRAPVLARSLENFPTRAMHPKSLVHEDRKVIHAVSELVDIDIHNIAHTIAKAGGGDIIRSFRQRGFNCNLLGALLLSLLRSHSPPPEMVDAIIVEMIARGVKEFVFRRQCNETADFMGVGLAEVAMSRAAAAFGDASQYQATVARILREILEYEGDPAPRPETAEEPAIPLPSNFYGGSVLPCVYQKFRLHYYDVDLFQGWHFDMRRLIYHRAAQLLAVHVSNGSIVEARPIVYASQTGSAEVPWIRQRMKILAETLLLPPVAQKQRWDRDGAGLLPLMRICPEYWVYYEKVSTNIARTEPFELVFHLHTSMVSLEALEQFLAVQLQSLDSLAGTKTFEVAGYHEDRIIFPSNFVKRGSSRRLASRDGSRAPSPQKVHGSKHSFRKGMNTPNQPELNLESIKANIPAVGTGSSRVRRTDVQRVIRCLRRAAAAYWAKGQTRKAAMLRGAATEWCDWILQREQAHLFAPQFRLLIQEVREGIDHSQLQKLLYFHQAMSSSMTPEVLLANAMKIADPKESLAPIERMLKTMLKHCTMDMACAEDYLSLAVLQFRLREKQLMQPHSEPLRPIFTTQEISINLARARQSMRRLVSSHSDYRLLICVANEIILGSLKEESGGLNAISESHRDQLTSRLQQLMAETKLANEEIPPALHRLVAKFLHQAGHDAESLVADQNGFAAEEFLVEMEPAVRFTVSPTHGPIDDEEVVGDSNPWAKPENV